MEYLTHKELKEMMLLSYKRVEEEKEEINKINVFPVPDQDTGDNLTKTLLGIKEAIEGKEFEDLEKLSDAILDGALTCAQGNAGVIYTGFLAGFLPQLNKDHADIERLSLAFEKGAERARGSIQDPKEGTILDVIDAAALAIKKETGKERDIVNAFKKAKEKASQALLATREKMEILRKANVVDAGGLGFLIILESHLNVLEKPSVAKTAVKKEEVSSEKIKRFVQIIANRYEVVSLIENPIFSKKEIQEKLKKLGNCLDMVKVKNRMKIHIHTDYPKEVKEVMRSFGQIQNLRVEDMTNEMVGEESVRVVSIGVVTDNQGILLPKIVERYQIKQVDFKYSWLKEKQLAGENIYQKLKEAEKLGLQTFPDFSAPNPKDYLTVFKEQLKSFNEVLCITASSQISNSYKAARKAKEMLPKPKKVFILDSLNVSGSQSLLVLRALELIREQREMNEVVKELKKLIPKIHFYIAIKEHKWLNNKVKGINKPHIDWIKKIKKIKIHPIIETRKGALKKGGVVFARDIKKALFEKTLKKSKKERKKGRKIRIIIGHTDNLKEAKELKKMLKEKIQAEVQFIGLDLSTACISAGPGSLTLAWMAI